MSIANYIRAYEKAVEKRGYFECELIQASDPAIRFDLKKKVEECEADCIRLKAILTELENDSFLNVTETVPQKSCLHQPLISVTPL